jgi:peptide chain release factor 3
VEEAYGGDIIGLFDPGIFHIGDTLCEGSEEIRYEGIPIFPAEHFARVRFVDAMKRKQFVKGIEQISEEGAIQVFKQPDIGVETLIIGVVGVLQFEVLSYRLKDEYGVDIQVQMLPYTTARWVLGGRLSADALAYTDRVVLVEDAYKRPVLLFTDPWAVGRIADKHPQLQLAEIPSAVPAQ